MNISSPSSPKETEAFENGSHRRKQPVNIMKGSCSSSVLFNEAGRSIESSCLLFQKKTWTRCYLLCSQPTDISTVVLYIYKSHKRRLKNDETSAISLNTFVGLESGFELKKQNNTMCVITQTNILIVSFRSPEMLIMWETWIHHACSKGSVFYAQLVGAPEASRAYDCINCEVRLHIHDGRIALVSGCPQRLIGFWLLNEIIRVCFAHNKMQFFGNDRSGVDDGMYSLICGRIQLLEKHYKLASKPGLLTVFLEQKEGDGLWNECKPEVSSKTVLRNSSIRSVQNSEIDHFSLPNIRRSSSRKSAPLRVVHASYVNVPTNSRFLSVSNASSMASCSVPYANEMMCEEDYVHSQSEPSVSSVENWDKASDLHLNSTSKEHRILLNSTISSARSLSRADSWPRPLADEIIRRREISLHSRKWYASNSRETKGRFMKQEKKCSSANKYEFNSCQGKSNQRLPKRSRSLGMEAKFLGASREENWNRAKRIIGGVRKSINELNVCKTIPLPSVDGMNRFTERLACNNIQELESTMPGFTSSLSAQSINRLPGLIKLPPKKFSLRRARHILTKSLQKSISGSFSKYDGERCLNHFNLEDATCLEPVVDSIESAVNKGRARLLEAERNSGFVDRTSFLNLSSNHSIKIAVPENAAVSSIWSTLDGANRTELLDDQILPKSDISCSQYFGDSNSFSQLLNGQPTKISENSVPKTPLFVTSVGNPATAESIKGSGNSTNESNMEPSHFIPFCTAAASLSGSYCNLEAKIIRNFSQRSAEVSRTVYVQIDPIATLGAIQTQQTMMRDRARVGSLVKNKCFSSQNSVESKDRSEEGLNRGGFFARRLWRKLPMSMSHADLRF
ncbi:unnamed protein product [Thelazia callipaeda]|uniref:IRS-type PTB domain-containing protein n=1 Tax=Thelazia callipaeda TaxID=103827 RepID=A0A0N5CNX7_THECL|nr:unnamed protein product [Thelazia callipaeda]